MKYPGYDRRRNGFSDRVDRYGGLWNSRIAEAEYHLLLPRRRLWGRRDLRRRDVLTHDLD